MAEGQGVSVEYHPLDCLFSPLPRATCPWPLAPYPAFMLHYFKFRQDLLDPAPAKEIYVKRGPGRGWPEECPPIRAANGFGFDLLANFDLTFQRNARGGWRIAKDIVVESDFEYAASKGSPGVALSQQYAWFWEKGQKLPHVISDNVYSHIANQVKISSYLFLATDPDEILLMTEVPNLRRSWRAMSAVIETDWYPASYPWHCVIELPENEKRVTIEKGEPLCRIIPLRRDKYLAKQMSHKAFDKFFTRGQKWLAKHGRFEHESGNSLARAGTVDITRTYVKQQAKSEFVVME
jgi:hypothetical protein